LFILVFKSMNIIKGNEIKSKDKKLLIMLILLTLLFTFWTGKGVVKKIPLLSKIYSSEKYNDIKITEEQLWNRIKGEETLYPSDSASINWESYGTQDSVDTDITPPLIEETVTEKLELPIKILLVGDSLVLEGFGPQFDKMIKNYEGIELHRYGKYSTGLNKIDYFDWYSYTDQLIDTIEPDILIIMIGANDGQGIVSVDGKNISFKDADNWNNSYRERVVRYLQLTNHRVKYIYWVGHPIPRDTNFYEKFERMNLIYKEECAKYPNAIYVDSWTRFSVDGKYSATLIDSQGVERTVKASDGVHLTTHGGNILSELVIESLKENVNLTNEPTGEQTNE